MEFDFGDAPDPDVPLRAAQLLFTLTRKLTYSDKERQERLKELAGLIDEHNLEAFAEVCLEKLPDLPQIPIATMSQHAKDTIKNLNEKLKDAEENLGDTEIVDLNMQIAKCLHETSSKERALQQYNKLMELKGMSSGQKIDVSLKKMLLGLFWKDFSLLQQALEEAEKLLETGGDWERRNRLLVYKGFYLMMKRKFTPAAACFSKTIATFTCTELCSYTKFVLYAIICNYIALDRVEFKTQIIDSPQVKSIYDSVDLVELFGPKAKNLDLREFVESLQNTNYTLFFFGVLNLHLFLLGDRYLNAHAKYWVKELRVKAYTQFLESYKTVTLEMMGYEFGMSETLLDKELSKFIASGRIQAKIDKVSGVVESEKLVDRNKNYQQVIKQGDLLLNKVQVLSRVLGV